MPPKKTFCFALLRLVYPMLPVSLEYPFLISLWYSQTIICCSNTKLDQTQVLQENFEDTKIQRNWQHRVHKTKQSKTKRIQRNWHHRVHKTKQSKTKRIQRNWHHRVHKTKQRKLCLVRLYLQLFIGGFMSYLRNLCLFAHCGVFLFCFASSCVPYGASFSGFFLFMDIPEKLAA
jgi:cation transport ATPase